MAAGPEGFGNTAKVGECHASDVSPRIIQPISVDSVDSHFNYRPIGGHGSGIDDFNRINTGSGMIGGDTRGRGVT